MLALLLTSASPGRMWQLKFVLFGILGLVIGFVVLYRRSRSFRFHIKYVSFNCFLLFAAIYLAVIGVFHPFDVENWSRAKGLVYNCLVKFFAIRVDFQGRDIFNSLGGKNFVVVANHQSSLDMIPLMKVTPRRTTFLAKKELLFVPLFGFAAWLCGVIFINRGHSKSARDVMDKTLKRIREEKVHLCGRKISKMTFVSIHRYARFMRFAVKTS